MRKRIFFATAALCFTPGAADAAAILDQLNDAPIKSSIEARVEDYQGQTFKVGLGGTFAYTMVAMVNDQAPAVDIDFYLAPIVNNIALFTQAKEVIIPSSTIPSSIVAGQVAWTKIDFSSFDIAVHPGDEFALVAHSSITNHAGNNVDWSASNPGTYSSGTPVAVNAQGWPLDVSVSIRTDFDQDFATYINVSGVPEPATWALFILGFGCMGANLRRRRGEMVIAA